MRRRDEYDDLADHIVFEDHEARKHLDAGNDGELSRRIAELIREHLCVEPPPTEGAR